MSNVTNLAVVREARRQQEKPNSVGKGFALLHRKIMDLPFYKDPEAAHLWIHLILKAKHAPEMVMTDLGEKHVGRGQLLSGRNALAFETGLIPDRVKYLLLKYKKLGMINWVSHGKFSIFTVTKYDDYQLNSVPADYQQITTPKPATTVPSGKVVPADYQQITTDNELLTNNSISKDIECQSAAEKSDEDRPIRIKRKASPAKRVVTPYEEMIAAYHEILPEMQGVEIIRAKRKSLMRSFWQQCNQEYQKQHGQPFTIENWRNYLEYIAAHCTWMKQDRPNGKGGFWAAKNLDYLVTDECYTKVKEQRANDRK